MINHIKMCDLFYKFEVDNNLFQWKEDNVFVWELVRFLFFNKIIEELGIYREAHSKQKLKNRIFRFANSFNNIFINNPLFANKCEIVCFGHSRRKLLSDNRYWDIYTDYFIDGLDDTILLEDFYIDQHFKPAKTKKIFYLDLYRLLWFSRSKIKKDKLCYDVGEICRISNEFNKAFNVKINLLLIFNLKI